MKHQIKLTENQKESIGLLYYNVKNAVEICEALREEKNMLDRYIRHDIIRPWQNKLQLIKFDLDRSLGVNEGFSEQIKNADTLGLHTIIQTYLSLTPEKRYALEQLFEAIKSDEEIKLEVA